MIAYLAGDLVRPCVVLSFDAGARHPQSGALLREWVKTLPGRSWVPQDAHWVVTATGAHPEREFTQAGIVVVGPDGEPTSLRDLVAPIAVPRPGDPDGMWEVHPRLGGRDLVAPRLPVETLWRSADQCWLVHPSVLAPGGVVPGWLEAPPSLATAAQEVAPSSAGSLRYDLTLDGLRGVPVTDLGCVSAAAAESMAAVGITSVHDLLHHLPRRYVDLSSPTPVRQATPGEMVAVVGSVTKVTVGRDNKMLKACVREANGTNVWCRWFNAGYLARRLKQGQRVVIFGKVETFSYSGGAPGFGMTSPMLEEVGEADAGKVIAFYPASAKADLSTWMLHHAAVEAVSRLGALTDPLPGRLAAERGMPARADAFRMVHDPSCMEETVAGRRRIVYDELLRLQLIVATARAAAKAEPAFAHTATALVEQYRNLLPFGLTAAQQRCAAQIAADMAAPNPMHRLLQGDVSSGKTALEIMAMLQAVSSGSQAVLVAPTAILAEQHASEITESVRDLRSPAGDPVQVVLFTNKVTGKARKAALEKIADGGAHIVVGTHALLADAVTFADLGVVVVDEQHRFGTAQRKALREKGAGRTPDTLYCTATPIPRTAVMTTFGDLDLSTIDELPPGRTATKTLHVQSAPTSDPESAPWRAIRSEVEAGRQAFVVCPLVSSSESAQDAAAHATATDLDRGALAGARIGVVTGKDSLADRTAVMSAFAAGELDVLVSTTVVEVGVNIPNATVMVVLGADRFGLAQLHQLRGRVGRGAHRGVCYLVAQPKSSVGAARLQAMCSTTDGFALAEIDLELRGAGHISGASQSGTGRDLKVADVVRDSALVAMAREDAAAIVADDPRLARRPGLRLEVKEAVGEDAAQWLLSA